VLDKGAIFKRALFNESMVFIVFASTLALWPPFVSEIKSFSYPYLNETKWWPLLLLFCFALLDVIGRFCVPYRVGLTKVTDYTASITPPRKTDHSPANPL
jgi:hypothetical protein